MSDSERCLKCRHTYTLTHPCIPRMKRYTPKAYEGWVCMLLSLWVWRKVGHWTEPELWQRTTEVMLGRNRCCRRVNLTVDQYHPPTQHTHTHLTRTRVGRKEQRGAALCFLKNPFVTQAPRSVSLLLESSQRVSPGYRRLGAGNIYWLSDRNEKT